MSAYTFTHGNLIPPDNGFKQPIPMAPVHSLQILLLASTVSPKMFATLTEVAPVLDARLTQASAALQAGLIEGGTRSATMSRSGGLDAVLQDTIVLSATLEDC